MKRWFSLAAVAALFALAGCGGAAGIPVTGKVVDGGKDFALAEGDTVSITMTSDDAKTSCSGTVQKDGTFAMKTSTGTDLPAGKYSVSVMHYKMPANASKSPPMPPTPAPYPETWEVSAASKTFTLDMGKLKKEPKPK